MVAGPRNQILVDKAGVSGSRWLRLRICGRNWAQNNVQLPGEAHVILAPNMRVRQAELTLELQSMIQVNVI